MWGRLNAGVTVGLLAWGVQACELKKPEIWVLNFGVLSPFRWLRQSRQSSILQRLDAAGHASKGVAWSRDGSW